MSRRRALPGMNNSYTTKRNLQEKQIDDDGLSVQAIAELARQTRIGSDFFNPLRRFLPSLVLKR